MMYRTPSKAEIYRKLEVIGMNVTEFAKLINISPRQMYTHIDRLVNNKLAIDVLIHIIYKDRSVIKEVEKFRREERKLKGREFCEQAIYRLNGLR